jgi:hypothetical protein
LKKAKANKEAGRTVLAITFLIDIVD